MLITTTHSAVRKEYVNKSVRILGVSCIQMRRSSLDLRARVGCHRSCTNLQRAAWPLSICGRNAENQSSRLRPCRDEIRARLFYSPRALLNLLL